MLVMRYCNREIFLIETGCTETSAIVKPFLQRFQTSDVMLDYNTSAGRMCVCHKDDCNDAPWTSFKYIQELSQEQISAQTTSKVAAGSKMLLKNDKRDSSNISSDSTAHYSILIFIITLKALN